MYTPNIPIHLNIWVSSVVKNAAAMQKPQEKQVQSLGQEEALEEGMAIHYNILAMEIPWREEPGELQSLQRVRHV